MKATDPVQTAVWQQRAAGNGSLRTQTLSTGGGSYWSTVLRRPLPVMPPKMYACPSSASQTAAEKELAEGSLAAILDKESVAVS
jgi:hypothetical protein